MKKKTIFSYFDEEVEYPNNVALNPIPYGVVWQYISSTFLNGFINYVEPFGCYVVNRYTLESATLSKKKLIDIEASEREEFTGTKKELIDLIVSEKKKMCHTNLGCFEDDIFIVAKIADEIEGDFGRYMFFWFDMDVSDCCIGRFITCDSEDEILKSLENFLHENYVENKEHEESHSEDSLGYHKLPLSFLRGWISF